MANTTFNGPVRSENGFQDISVAESTGVETTNSTYGNNASIGGTLAVTGATSLSSTLVGQLFPVTSVTDSTLAPTAAQSGTIFSLNRAAGITVTLPAASAGIFYEFHIGTTFTGTFILQGASSADTSKEWCSNLIKMNLVVLWL